MADILALNGSPLSSLCFGCMQFGGTANVDDSRAMFDVCVEHGINFFDTAHTYTSGKSEEFLGSFLQKDRDAAIVATKTGYTGGSGRANILQQFDASRRRLNLDVIDVLYLHRWDPDTGLEETFETLCTLQQAGKLRYIGVSNFAAWQVMKAQTVAARLETRIDVMQPMYSLIKRQAEVELFPMALSEDIAVVPYSPLGSGLLTGKYQTGGEGRLSTDKRYAARYSQPWMVETAKALSTLAHGWGIAPATLAVAWAAKHPAVSAPIISGRNATQLESSLKAVGMCLTAEQYKQIEALSLRPAPATDRLEETLT